MQMPDQTFVSAELARRHTFGCPRIDPQTSAAAASDRYKTITSAGRDQLEPREIMRPDILREGPEDRGIRRMMRRVLGV
jgi:hypothetical protein